MLGLIGKTIKFETNCYSSIQHKHIFIQEWLHVLV